jgi:nucleotide-binding universal stress UspA family protein
MFQRILVPLDGSPGSERAIPTAARIARGAGGSLVFLHVVPPLAAFEKTPSNAGGTASDVEREERALADAASYLAEVIASHAGELYGIPTEMDVAFGLTSPLLASTARLEQVDLVVMCSHRGAGLGQWGVESIAQQTMRRSPVPLLILNERGEMPQPDVTRPLRVLVPLDGSLFAEAALEPAIRLLSQLTSSAQDEFCLVRVVEDLRPEHADAQHRARQEAEHYLKVISERLGEESDARPDFRVASVVKVGGNVASAILEEAKKTRYAPLIVMATHGREGVERLTLGSIAERVLSSATCPLLIVCPGSATGRTAKPGQLAAGKL